MKHHIQSFLLLLLMTVSSLLPSAHSMPMMNFNKELIPSVSCNSFISFIRENPLLTLFCCSAAAMGLYKWYQFRYLSKPPTGTKDSKKKTEIAAPIVNPKEVETPEAIADVSKDNLPEMLLVNSLEEKQNLPPLPLSKKNEPDSPPITEPELSKKEEATPLDLTPHIVTSENTESEQKIIDDTTQNAEKLTAISLTEIDLSSKTEKEEETKEKNKSPHKEIKEDYQIPLDKAIINIATREKLKQVHSNRSIITHRINKRERQYWQTGHHIIYESWFTKTELGYPKEGIITIYNELAQEIKSWYTMQTDTFINLPNKNIFIFYHRSNWAYFNLNTKITKYFSDYRPQKTKLKENSNRDANSTIAVSKDENIVFILRKNGIDVFNIKDLYSIKHKRLMHTSVNSICFSPSASYLISNDNDSLKLWNLTHIDWNNSSDVTAKTIDIPLSNIDFITDTYITAISTTPLANGERKQKVLKINISNTQQVTVLCEYICRANSFLDIYYTAENKYNKIYDLIALHKYDYATNKTTLLLLSLDQEEELCRIDLEKPYLEKLKLLMSKNKKWCAMVYPFILLKKQKNGTFTRYLSEKIEERCYEVCDDGSFCLSDSSGYQINFYTKNYYCYMTLKCNYHINRVKFKHNNIVCSHSQQYETHFQRPSKTDCHFLKNLIKNITDERQQLFLHDMCRLHHQKERGEIISLEKNSPGAHIFQSFDDTAQKFLKDALSISVF